MTYPGKGGSNRKVGSLVLAKKPQELPTSEVPEGMGHPGHGGGWQEEKQTIAKKTLMETMSHSFSQDWEKPGTN